MLPFKLPTMPVKVNLANAQARMKHFADKRRSEVHYQVGDWVLVKLHPYRQHSVFLRKNHKLSMRYFGPYQILQKIGKVAYKLALSEDAKIHPVFHVPILKKYVGGLPGCITLLPPVTNERGPIIQPAFILQVRIVLRHSQPVKKLLISWLGLPMSDCSWEDLTLLSKQYPH